MPEVMTWLSAKNTCLAGALGAGLMFVRKWNQNQDLWIVPTL
jgi:hypothetical protein